MKNIFALLLLFNLAIVSAQVDRTVMPEPGPSPEINLGSPKEFTLPNGLQVLVVEDAKLPRITLSLDIDNPPILEGDKAGVSTLTSNLLGQGSVNIPKDAFYEEVDFMGARLNIGISGAFATGLSKYSERIMELMAEAAISPNFTQEALELEKTKLKDNLKSSTKDVGFIATRVSSALAYGKKHPKGEFTTAETVDNVTLEDIKSFYSNRFVPANAYLIVSGDITFEEAREMAGKYFSKWKKASPLNLSYSTPKDVQYTQINFIDMPNAVQSEIRVQNLIDLKLGDKDYFPALLANYILGGGGDARLFQVLREEKGYTYGAYSGARPSKYGASLFRAQASVRNEVTDSAVVAFLDVINDFKNNPVSQKELDIAKAKYSGNFIMSLEDEERVAELALNIKQNELPANFYENYLEQINKVTVEDISDAAQRLLQPQNMRIVIAGKGSEVLEALEKMTYNGKKLPVKYFNAEGDPAEKPDYTAPPADNVSKKEILQKYIKAIGGTEKLQSISTMYASASTSIQGMTLDIEFKKGNGKYLMDTKMQGNSISKQVYDGEKGFTFAQGQKIEATGKAAEEMAKSAIIFPELKWLNDESVVVDRVDMVEGKQAYVLKVSDDNYSFYDTESGLKIKQESSTQMGPNTIKSTLLLSDYREVEGVKVPFSMQQNVGPQSFDLEVTEVKFNEDFQVSDFE
ncbi:insulinase family protein [Robertkochia marina]|uniref:Insulinase family protein n=1 Tax=Robertkochia marina TaxID=1227945 RepID=A0A4V3UYG3_9FLAO|nr:pitrilysin family protein [Robertkochia marina]THD69558.1 insulinase family protein [Robertkochia marina]TRZ47643.1 insulinase family protein [Robertkochia marina]